MNVEEAIKMALEYENKVVEVYREALEQAKDPTGRRVFKVLSDEEVDHVEYLKAKLKEWEETGEVTSAGLKTSIPSSDRIKAGVKNLKQRVAVEDADNEIRLLRKALDVEVETSNFYRQMVEELPAESKPLFARFVEIEEGHQAIVQAEMDAVSGLGFWFDHREFDLEGA